MGGFVLPSTAIKSNAAATSREFTTATVVRSARFTTDDPSEVQLKSDKKLLTKPLNENRLRYSTDLKVSTAILIKTQKNERLFSPESLAMDLSIQQQEKIHKILESKVNEMEKFQMLV